MAEQNDGDATSSPGSTVSVTKLVGMRSCAPVALRAGDGLVIDFPGRPAFGGVSLFGWVDYRWDTGDFEIVDTKGAGPAVQLCVETMLPAAGTDLGRGDQQRAPRGPVDLFYGVPDQAWPSDRFWRDKIWPWDPARSAVVSCR